MMSLLNRFCNGIGDLIIGPWISVTVALVVFAGTLAAMIVALFRWVARPQIIRHARSRLVARSLELLLFGHDVRALLTAIGRILVANAVYLWQFMRPLSVITIPLTVLLIQGAAWFTHRPFRIGEPIIVEVQLAPGLSVLETQVNLVTSDGLTVTAGPVRIPSQSEVCYRLTGTKPGNSWVDVAVDNHLFRKQIIVGDNIERLTNERSIVSWKSLVNPGEDPLAVDSPVSRIRTRYSPRIWSWGLSEYDAGLAGLLLTMIFSLIIARVFRVSLY